MSSFPRRPGDTRAWWIQEPPAVAQRQAYSQYRPPARPYPPLKEVVEEEEEEEESDKEEEAATVKSMAVYEDAAIPAEEAGVPISRTHNGSWPQRILRNRKFWMIFGLAVMLLTFGLVLVLKAAAQKAMVHSIRPLAGEQAQSATPLIASPARLTGNRTSTVTASTTTSLTNRVACPASNGTMYTATDRSPFRILCDYGSGAATGVVSGGSVATASFEECLDTCAKDASCCGAGWGREPEKGTLTCWKKMRVRVGGPRDRAKGTPVMTIFGEREMLL